MKHEEYIDVKELSRRIKMAPGTIRNMVSKGDLVCNVHYVKPTARKVLFIWSGIESWLYGSSNTGPSNRHTDQDRKNGLINI